MLSGSVSWELGRLGGGLTFRIRVNFVGLVKCFHMCGKRVEILVVPRGMGTRRGWDHLVDYTDATSNCRGTIHGG